MTSSATTSTAGKEGTVSPGERDKLYYCRALGIPPAAFGGGDSARTGTLVLPREFSGEQVKLLNLLDIGRGVSLRAESTSVAVRIARELSDGMTQAERIATHEFLTEVARAVRWPAFQGAGGGWQSWKNQSYQRP